MSNHRYRIRIPSLSEYTYRTLKTLTQHQRQLLSPEEQKIFKTDTSLSDFCHKEQLDRLLLILVKVGKYVNLRVADEDDHAEQLEFNAVNQFQFPQKKVEATEALARENVFCMDASDVMLSAMMTTQNIHSPLFKLTTQSLDIGKKFTGIRSMKTNPDEERSEASRQGYEDMNALLIQTLNSMIWARHTLSLEQGTIRVLAVLFANKHGALTMQEIAQKTMMADKIAFLRSNVDSLLKDKLIISDKNHGPKQQINKGAKNNKRVYYMLLPSGIKKVMEYINYIHKQTFGSRSN